MPRTMNRLAVVLASSLAGIVSFPALAAEGRIPIPFTSPPTTPIVIGTPGHYILTRDLSPTGPGPTIDISVAGVGGDVDLDLNGFVARGNAGQAVVRVTVVGGATSEVTIHDGALQDGANSIIVSGAARSVIVERIRSGNATGPAMQIFDVLNTVIRDCVITDAGNTAVYVANFAGVNTQATIEGNLIRSTPLGIVVGGTVTAAILNNRVELITGGIFGGGTGISVGGLGCLISENTIRQVSAPGAAGTNAHGIAVSGNGCKVFDNTITGATGNGIDVMSSGALVWKNVIRETAIGIRVVGDFNQIEGNVMAANGCGLVFLLGADQNVYRENMARGSTGGPACAGGPPCVPNFLNSGAGNSTPGDNFIPTGVAPCD